MRQPRTDVKSADRLIEVKTGAIPMAYPSRQSQRPSVQLSDPLVDGAAGASKEANIP